MVQLAVPQERPDAECLSVVIQEVTVTDETSANDNASFWETRYGEREQIWSGRPNAALVAEATKLVPGRALDLGCGEGGDSIWLAEQGWTVTAVDISSTAIARATAAAKERGIPDERISWTVADLASWEPTGAFELVSACFFHSPVDFPRVAVLQRVARAVMQGGHLLVVSHAEAPPWARNHDHDDRHFPGPEEERADLKLEEEYWSVVVSERRSRIATGPDGQQASLDDVVTLVRRL